MNRRRLMHQALLLPAIAGIMCMSASCVRRELEIHTNPEGALVYLNDTEVGRTPLVREFTFYGTYDIAIRMDGYETRKVHKLILAPWWQWIPFDLPAELLPLTDHQYETFDLTPTTQTTATPDELLFRAAQLRKQLPTTLPGTGPAPATQAIPQP